VSRTATAGRCSVGVLCFSFVFIEATFYAKPVQSPLKAARVQLLPSEHLFGGQMLSDFCFLFR
jgi:hypothetical protein